MKKRKPQAGSSALNANASANPTANAHAERFTIWKWNRDARPRRCADLLAREEPLEIRVRGQSVAVTMRTPGHDAELAAGFLVAEGVVKKRSDVVEIAPCGQATEPDNTWNVYVAAGLELDLDALTRHVFASSSCGLCGKASIESVHLHFPPIDETLTVPVETVLSLPGQLRQAQEAFERTGGLHAAGLFSAAGERVVVREDVGRHNAVDKVIGHAFLSGSFPCPRSILMVSGRASFEIMQKALAARIPLVAAVSAPSSLAVEFARESGQTLIGFLREGAMNIYAHPSRILFPR
ncbi:MAG: formate dehydrogenase accessory sulfurtransferase FdhD [Verrucomicrobiota bacterium]